MKVLRWKAAVKAGLGRARQGRAVGAIRHDRERRPAAELGRGRGHSVMPTDANARHSLRQTSHCLSSHPPFHTPQLSSWLRQTTCSFRPARNAISPPRNLRSCQFFASDLRCSSASAERLSCELSTGSTSTNLCRPTRHSLADLRRPRVCHPFLVSP